MIWKIEDEGSALGLDNKWPSGDNSLWNAAITPDGRYLLTAAENIVKSAPLISKCGMPQVVSC